MQVSLLDYHYLYLLEFFFCVWCMPANNYYVLPLYQNIRHYLTLTVSKNVYFDRGSSMYYLSLSLKSCVRHVRV